MAKRLRNIHPGEVLKEEFLMPLGLNQTRLASEIRVQPIAISQIVNGKRAITTETALLLGKYFGVPANFWTQLQASYDAEEVSRRKEINQKLSKIIPFNYEASVHVQH